VIVNVCPAAVTSASPERVWQVITNLERGDEWLDARVLSAEPPGPMTSGQTINLSAPSLGREFAVTMEVRDLDPHHLWVDLVVHLPFGIDNHEHLTLTKTEDGGTLLRFN
jgi:uncharacterized protein YndB with AHSA1/START domain